MNNKKQNYNYEAVIGLEIHAELKTQSKMFCSCANAQTQIDADQKSDADKRRWKLLEPNTNICPVCLGMPGTLPVINKQAVEWTILTGLALNCHVGHRLPHLRGVPQAQHHLGGGEGSVLMTKWDRKNYFYPDLPKGYQISQYDLPLVYGGYLEINTKSEVRNPKQIQNSNDQNSKRSPISNSIRVEDDKIRRIGITRIHLEEDTGTSKHPEGRAEVDYSLLDFNRAGVPLMELVTEPDLRSASEAKEFCKNYQQILRTLKVADADMEKGQLRCEANISVRDLSKSKRLGTKVEVKNLNSFKSVERAINYEIQRHTEVLERGEKVVQETRGWDEKGQKTYVMRVKETSADYRYFPEPDLPPVTLAEHELRTNKNENTNKQRIIIIDEIRKKLPEMPKDKAKRYQKKYKLAKDDAIIIASNPKKAGYFESCIKLGLNLKPARPAGGSEILNLTNWMINEIPDLSVQPKHLVELIRMIDQSKISQKIAKEMLPELKQGKSPAEIIKEKGMEQISDKGRIESIVEKVIKDNPDAVAKIKAGKTGVIGFLVGQVMLATKGQANPKIVNEIIRDKIK